MGKCLVTGAAGFIGSHVVDALLAEGHDVVALDDLSGGSIENVNAAATWIQASVVDSETITRLCERERFTYVFHLAAYAAEGLSHFIRQYNYTNNVLGSINLINAAIRTDIECFVYTSSIAVYGAGQLPMIEATVPQPEDPYGIAKYAVELDLKAAHELFGLDSVIFRPHNVYGERQNIGDRFRNVVGIFMNQAMRGEPFSIFGDGSQTRAFSYIAAVAPAIAKSVEIEAARNEIFNVGADRAYTVMEIAQEVASAMGVPLEVDHHPARREVVHAYSSHEKVRRIFGGALEEEVPLVEGIARMAAWAKAVGSRPTPRFTHLEISRNLPPSWQTWASGSERST
jgi:UDP-glucose 4-epimerase